MKNFYEFRKAVKGKLNRILEEKIDTIVLPRNAFGYSAKKGHYNVTPFGTSDYIISVVLNGEEEYNDFYNEFYENEEENTEIFNTINWKSDRVVGYHGVDLYVNEASLEQAQSIVKGIFEAIEED